MVPQTLQDGSTELYCFAWYFLLQEKLNLPEGICAMANVCLIYPRDINLNFFPLGIGYIASYLRDNKHKVRLLDISEPDINLLLKLKSDRPDVIGISITTPQLRLSSVIVKLIRETLPGVPIVAGGIHPSFFKDRFMADLDVDYVIYGEGEVTMNELCDAISSHGDLSRIDGLIYRSVNGTVVVNPPRKLIADLNILSFPARDLVNYNTYLQPPGLVRGVWTNRCGNIITGRGCPGRCTYCGANYLWGNAYRRRTVDNVLQEIDLLVEKYDIDGLYLTDDTFLMNTKWIEEFTEKFIARKFGFKWACYGRVDTVNQEILTAIKKAGCVQVEYGIESCSKRVLNKIKKNTDVEKIISSVNMTRNSGLRALGSFIFGFPEDDVEDLKASINISSSINLDFVTCYFATPFPGSELYDQAVLEGRILEKDMSRWYVRNNNIMKINLDTKTLNDYRNSFLKKYRYKNILFFLKNPLFLLKLCLFALKNYRALYKSLKQSVQSGCFDDAGYYFYTYISNNMKNRNYI